jgi:menaquinone-specific isochorismate synthase
MIQSLLTMPVSQTSVDPLNNEKELYSYLVSCQRKLNKNKTEIYVSIAQKIAPIDPLAVLKIIAPNQPLYFYWENCRKEEAITAYGAVNHLIFNGKDRFIKVQKFIQENTDKIIKIGEHNLNYSTPHFCCSFSFLDSPDFPRSPFPGATVFLPQFQVIRKKNTHALIVNLAITKDTNLELICEQIQYQLKLISQAPSRIKYIQSHLIENALIEEENALEFKQSVIGALQSIAKQKFSKIVLAHALNVILPEPFDAINTLAYLRKNHPDCYIFSTSNGQGKQFIGASPERLISIHKQQFVTDSLAGSAPRGKNTSEDIYLAKKLLRSEKEKREHQAVTDFILQRLWQLGLQPQQAPLQLLKLSNIQHLWTPIYSPLTTDIHPLEILGKLHPTPAVAGVPTKIVCEEITRYESFDRSLYGAPIGWVDYQGNSEFIVCIRSALIDNNRATIYGGAGIVAGSDPHKEFDEVQLKLQSLLRALF